MRPQLVALGRVERLLEDAAEDLGAHRRPVVGAGGMDHAQDGAVDLQLGVLAVEQRAVDVGRHDVGAVVLLGAPEVVEQGVDRAQVPAALRRLHRLLEQVAGDQAGVLGEHREHALQGELCDPLAVAQAITAGLDQLAHGAADVLRRLAGDLLAALGEIRLVAAEKQQRLVLLRQLGERDPERHLQPVGLVGVVDPQLVEVAEHHVARAGLQPVAQQLVVVLGEVLVRALHLPDADTRDVHVHPLGGGGHLSGGEHVALLRAGDADGVLLEDLAGFVVVGAVALQQMPQIRLRAGHLGGVVVVPALYEARKLLRYAQLAGGHRLNVSIPLVGISYQPSAVSSQQSGGWGRGKPSVVSSKFKW